MGDLREDLARSAIEVRETHISWVFLAEQTVLKVKKPVDFGFLDFSDSERRRQACLNEVRLNARLAPGVYSGVVPITRRADGVHEVAGAGAVVDWGVQMRRLADADRADLRLAAGRLDAGHLDRLARELARFHRAAASTPEISAFGQVERIRVNVRENFAQAHSRLSGLVSAAQQREVEDGQLAFLEQHAARFMERVESGRIRDGHGDLRLEHVYLDAAGAPTIIDCIEFNERFRYADVCADIAFLSMDLAFQGRVDLKERLLAAYASESDDHDLYALVDFYESYRAYVRAKISALALDSAALPERRALESQARRYFLLSLASERAPDSPPRLIAIGGLIASGKSTLARAVAAELALSWISSDRVRKSLCGVEPTTPLSDAAFDASYSEAFSERVYAEVLRRAEVVLRSGRSVVIDASFRSSAARVAARALALRLNAPFVLLECRAAREVSRARLLERALGPSESDGRSQIFEDFVARYQPITELEPSEHVVVDTSGSLEQALGALRARGVL
jgi:aminoglycoside phosphotransferase family enzyme/predicted kinase